MSKPRAANTKVLCGPVCFCCSKKILQTDNLSFLIILDLKFLMQVVLVLLYHVCYQCSCDSNAFSTIP